MRISSDYILSTLSDAVIISVGATGAIFAILSAYNLTYNSAIIIIITVTSALIFSAVFHAPKKVKRIGLAVCGIALFVGYYMYSTEINGGFVYFFNIVSRLFHKLSIDLPTFNFQPYLFFFQTSLITAFFTYFSVIFTFVIAFALISMRSTSLCFLFSLIFVFPSFIFINMPPDIEAIILYLAFILTVFLTNSIRLGRKRTSSAVAVLVPMLIFLVLVRTVSPEETYVRSDIGEKIYEFFANRLPLNPETSENPLPTVSGVDYQGNPLLSVDLRNAEPPEGTGVVMSVKTNLRGIHYLRGITYDTYSDSSWTITPNDPDITIIQYKVALLPGTNPEFPLNPHTYATYSAMTAEDENGNVGLQSTAPSMFHISSFSRGIAYMPYLSFYNGDDGFSIENDSYVMRNTAYSGYTFMTYDPMLIGSLIGSGNSYRPVDNSDEETFNRIYGAIVNERYYNLPHAQFYFFRNLLSKESLVTDGDDYKTITAIIEYVQNSATYDLKAPKAPIGEDFIEYFLTESKSGFCIHFASAATCMLRAAGYPARYVTGYVANVSSGEVWTAVTEKAAHAWVEVYFDGIGWIPFDPTPGIPGVTAPPVAETSEETSQVESTTSVPEITESETSSENSENGEPFTVDLTTFAKVLLLSLSVFAVLALPFIRRRYINTKRINAFTSESTNKAVICAWQYLERLLVYEVKPPTEVYETALKAAFSNHKLSDDERKSVVEFAVKSAAEVDSSLHFFRKIVFRYLKCLY
ncbi:MAG: transglutaminaseTgpA domain-containing protein [Eubacteriales bacterium]|nr:transglutaminaseTgpA domain-containing protein [Eubacteriales bacterium]MDD4474859.1 transglutaminaseTgpA domain-containing protein [Eubacteriales bacterium]